ncbi:TPA: hypothetical protein I7243_22350 [Vibrio vulnificus]|nr:hypothetical protein [Vibrio vulnificus]
MNIKTFLQQLRGICLLFVVIFGLIGCDSSGYFDTVKEGNPNEGTLLEGVAPEDILQLQLIPSPPLWHAGNSNVSVPVNASLDFQVIAAMIDGRSIDVTNYVKWIVNDGSILSLSGKSALGISPGVTNIQADYGGVLTNSLEITVTEEVLTSIYLSPSYQSIYMGQVGTVKAIGIFKDASEKDITNFVDWNIDNITGFDISPIGEVTGSRPGIVNVNASWGNVFTNDSVEVEVLKRGVLSLTLTPINTVLPKGLTTQLMVVAEFDDGMVEDITDQITWSVSDDALFTVTESGEVFTKNLGKGEVKATFSGVDSNIAYISVVDEVPISLTIDPISASIVKGGNQAYQAWALFSDLTRRDVTQLVQWLTEIPQIATINQDGLALGLNTGNVNISAKYENILSDESLLTVTNAKVVTITVTPESSNIPLGDTQQFTAVARLSDGSTVNITNAATWTTESESILRSLENGLMRGIEVGVTEVFAEYEGIRSVPVQVSVSNSIVVNLEITPKYTSVALGNKNSYQAVATFSDGTSKEVTSNVVWQSSNNTVASLSSNGIASTLSLGTANIHASYNGMISDEAIIDVTGAVLESLLISPEKISFIEGETKQLALFGIYSDGSQKDETNNSLVSWSVGDVNVATVDTRGLLTGVNSGVSDVRASLFGILSNTAEIEVSKNAIESIQISPAGESISLGTSLQYTAIARYLNNTTEDVTELVSWVSSDEQVATLSALGVAESQGIGTTNIVATLSGISSNSVALSVTNPILMSIQITPPAQSIASGLSVQYQAIGEYSDGSTQDISDVVSWSSTHASVAVVHPSGKADTLSVGTSNITARFDGVVSNTAVLTVTNAIVASLQVSPGLVSIALGTSQQLVVVGNYTDGTSNDLTDMVAWSSVDGSVAQVSNQGVVSGVGKGVTSVTASLNGISSNAVSITVNDALMTGIQITPPNNSIPLGLEQQYTATGLFSDGTTQDITASVNWFTSDISKLLISQTGLASTAELGTVTVYAVLNSIKSNEAVLVITDAVLTNIQLSPLVSNVPAGSSQQYTATGIFTNSTTQDLSSLVNWLGSDASVAVVDANGYATGVTQGSITITANLNGVTSEVATLNVTEPTLVSVEISHITHSEPVGYSEQVNAVATYSDGSSADITNSATWVSSNTSVATVTQGLVQAVNPGDSIITAVFGGVTSNELALTVTAAVVESVSVTPLTASIAKGLYQQYVANATFSDGHVLNVTSLSSWVSSDVGVAVINSTGQAEGVNNGVASITAQYNGVLSDTALLTVTDAVIASITVTPQTADISNLPGQNTLAYLATATFSDGTTTDITSEVSWISGTPSVATIESSGVVTGYTAGVSNITATRDGVTSNIATLNVTAPTLTQIVVTEDTMKLDATGLTQYRTGGLTATGTYSNGQVIDITSQVTWDIDLPSVATVSTSGLVSAVADGIARVNASLDSVVSNDAVITVERFMTQLELTQQFSNTGTILTNDIGESAGTSRILQPKITYSDGSSSFMRQEDPEQNNVSWNFDATGFEHLGRGKFRATTASGGSLTNVSIDYDGFTAAFNGSLTSIAPTSRSCDASTPYIDYNGMRFFCAPNEPDIIAFGESAIAPTYYLGASGFLASPGDKLALIDWSDAEPFCKRVHGSTARIPTATELSDMLDYVGRDALSGDDIGTFFRITGWASAFKWWVSDGVNNAIGINQRAPTISVVTSPEMVTCVVDL